MAYGTAIARGVLGDPSAQARGKRTAGFNRKEPREKPMKDVPLRKWDSHSKALDEMKNKLKEHKKKWMDEPDPDLKATYKQEWRNGFDAYETTKAQLQQMRNAYHQQWLQSVEEMENVPENVQRSRRGSGLGNMLDRNDKYITGSQIYKDLRDNSVKLDSWEVGQEAPNFRSWKQSPVYGEKTADGYGQFTLNQDKGGDLGYLEPGASSLDQMPLMIYPGRYHFYQQSYAETNGDTSPTQGYSELGGNTEFENKTTELNPQADPILTNQNLPEKANGGTVGKRYKFDINGDLID